jgi:hypothetical protein
MAKALLGHTSRMDPRVTAELCRLRKRIEDLESQLLRLQAEHDALQAASSGESLLVLDTSTAATKEPVLA